MIKNIINKLNDFKNKLDKQAYSRLGFVAIETVIALGVAMLIILLFLGFWLYLYPRVALEKEVHNLAQQAKVTGGLTNSQVTEFAQRMDDVGYSINSLTVSTSDNPVADTSQYNGLVNVYPKGGVDGSCSMTGYQNYVKRTSSSKIIITVKVDSNMFIKGPLSVFKVLSTLSDVYVVSETVMSERNKC